MSIQLAWPHLHPAVQAWLIDNNGDVLTAEVTAAVVAAGGAAEPGRPLVDEEVDWIEAVANEEQSDSP